jgi:hypothetical protein
MLAIISKSKPLMQLTTIVQLFTIVITTFIFWWTWKLASRSNHTVYHNIDALAKYAIFFVSMLLICFNHILFNGVELIIVGYTLPSFRSSVFSNLYSMRTLSLGLVTLCL